MDRTVPASAETMAAGSWTVAAAIGAGVAFAALAHRARALTASGAAVGGGLAACLVGLGGWAWVGPGLTFFVLSSALSKLQPRPKTEVARRFEKGAVRDAGQVLANGGVAWGLLILWAVLPPSWSTGQGVLYAGGCGAFAAAAADTWATELGTLSPERPRSIRSGRPVPTGTSGGVSILGTLGGVLGAGSVAAAALLGATATVGLGATITGGGIAGMLADSLAGATIQAQYRDPATGRHTELPPAPDAVPVQGWNAITNDTVNWIGTAVGGGVSALGFLLFAA